MEEALSRLSDFSEWPEEEGTWSLELPGVVGRDGERKAGEGAVKVVSLASNERNEFEGAE